MHAIGRGAKGRSAATDGAISGCARQRLLVPGPRLMIVQSLRNHVIVAAMEPAGKATEPYPMLLPAAAARPEAAEASAASAVAGARLALTNDAAQLAEAVTHGAAFLARVMQQANQVVVGQTAMLERILIGLCAGGHCLIEGVPGLAKTLAVKTVADATTASFARIQFTPDLLPADITGTMIYNMQRGEFTQKRGPLFANLVLADEVNRAPAKVQSALLEAMQERQVTIGEQSHPLPDPFLVLATQNPIEQEGTYALPEAQLDRFMLLIKVDYPTAAQEREMLDRQNQPGGAAVTPPAPVASVEDIRRARALVPRIFIEPRVRDFERGHPGQQRLDVGFAERLCLRFWQGALAGRGRRPCIVEIDDESSQFGLLFVRDG